MYWGKEDLCCPTVGKREALGVEVVVVVVVRKRFLFFLAVQRACWLDRKRESCSPSFPSCCFWRLHPTCRCREFLSWTNKICHSKLFRICHGQNILTKTGVKKTATHVLLKKFSLTYQSSFFFFTFYLWYVNEMGGTVVLLVCSDDWGLWPRLSNWSLVQPFFFLLLFFFNYHLPQPVCSVFCLTEALPILCCAMSRRPALRLH